MDGDMNDIFQKLNTMLEDKDMSNNLKNILNNFSSSNESDNSSASSNDSNDNNESHNSHNSSNNTNKSDSNSSQGMPEFDINTILKIKSIMDSFNKNKDDPRSNLLLSLKPYLAENKKEKIDQYVKFLQFAKVLEVLNPRGGDNLKNE